MNRPANPHRGEAQIVVGGRELRLRASFENLVATEEEIGSLFALVERASDGRLTVAEITALLFHCAQPDDRPPRDEFGRAVVAMGLLAATAPVRAILSQVLQGQS